jgi:hypothetical protein
MRKGLEIGDSYHDKKVILKEAAGREFTVHEFFLHDYAFYR